MTDKERRLGLENAKLSLKIHRQRLVINGKDDVKHTAYVVSERAEAVARENAELRRRNARLMTENSALRIYIAEGKVKPEGLGAFILRVLGR